MMIISVTSNWTYDEPFWYFLFGLAEFRSCVIKMQKSVITGTHVLVFQAWTKHVQRFWCCATCRVTKTTKAQFLSSRFSFYWENRHENRVLLTKQGANSCESMENDVIAQDLGRILRGGTSLSQKTRYSEGFLRMCYQGRWASSGVHAHIRVHTQPCIYICTHMYTHSHAHTHTHTHAYTPMHTHVHAYTHAHTHAYTPMNTSTHIHTCTYIHIHTHAHTYPRTHTHACTHTATMFSVKLLKINKLKFNGKILNLRLDLISFSMWGGKSVLEGVTNSLSQKP
jgi:hypothetical protein